MFRLHGSILGFMVRGRGRRRRRLRINFVIAFVDRMFFKHLFGRKRRRRFGFLGRRFFWRRHVAKFDVRRLLENACRERRHRHGLMKGVYHDAPEKRRSGSHHRASRKARCSLRFGRKRLSWRPLRRFGRRTRRRFFLQLRHFLRCHFNVTRTAAARRMRWPNRQLPTRLLHQASAC